MLEAIKASRYRVKHNLREIHKITQWKDGCIYATKSIGMLVCTPEYADALRATGKYQVGPVSTRISKQLV